MPKRFKYSALCTSSFMLTCAVTVSGCALTVVSDSPSIDPPRIINSDKRDQFGRYTSMWDRPGAFGKIPQDLKATGDAACLIQRVDLEAIGYHPHARDIGGQPVQGGGFYCAVKLARDQPDLRPPRLVRTNGVIGWDRPSAFGAVPAGQQKRGDSICEQNNTNMRAIAYHPWARNEKGEAIEGGGFFCAKPQS